ncbi:hypothetical protein IC582_030349 [Cucumis melo]
MLLIFVKGTPCQLSIGSINNIVAVAMIVEDNIGCPNVKVLVDVEHSTRKDVVYPSNYIDVNGIIKLLNRHAMNNMEDVDMIHIPMNELIFGNDKFVYLAREDLLHYCGMVEIGYMCILAYITFHWMLHVIDLRENCVYILDSLWSKVNEDIHGVINVVEDMASETRSTMLSINSKMETCKGNLHLQCPRQLDSVGCGYYVQKYILEIVHNSSTSITNLEIDEIRTEWAAFVSRFVCWMIVFAVVLYGSVYYWFAMDGRMCCLICVIIYISGYIGGFGVVGLIVLNIVFYMEVYAGILGIIVCIE